MSLANAPKLTTAIPKRRYRLGEFSLVLLGEIESPARPPLRYVLAVIAPGAAEPHLYIVSQQSPVEVRDQGSHQLRVISADGDQVLGAQDRWKELEAFAEQGIKMVRQRLALEDETLQRLL